MSLLDTLKSLLGLGSSRQESRRSGDVGVTVEREPEEERAPPAPSSAAGSEPEPDAETEHEVKGTDEATGATDEAAEDTPADDPDHRADGEPTTEIKGIGPAYAERLEDAGVGSIADLADADPEDLAERTDLSEKRVGRWVERAQAR